LRACLLGKGVDRWRGRADRLHLGRFGSLAPGTGSRRRIAHGDVFIDQHCLADRKPAGVSVMTSIFMAADFL
jgi:hypothetical protein